MANAIYPSAKKALLDGGIVWGTDTIKVVLLTSSYTYNSAHDYLNDITAGYRVATSAALSSKTTTSGQADAADYTFSALSGSAVASLVVYKDTGTESTSSLICYLDTVSGGGALSFTPSGADVILTWGATGIFKL